MMIGLPAVHCHAHALAMRMPSHVPCSSASADLAVLWLYSRASGDGIFQVIVTQRAWLCLVLDGQQSLMHDRMHLDPSCRCRSRLSKRQHEVGKGRGEPCLIPQMLVHLSDNKRVFIVPQHLFAPPPPQIITRLGAPHPVHIRQPPAS